MAKRVHRSKRQKRVEAKKRLYWISGITAIVIIVVIVGIILAVSNTNQVSSYSEFDQVNMPVEIDRKMTNENTTGDPNAPVKLEVFSNYQCSHCKIFADTIEPEIINKYVNTGKVYLVQNSLSWQDSNATMAAFCAMDQGKFWQYHDLLFANQTNEKINGIANENLELFARVLDLDTEQFNQCVASNKYSKKIEEIYTEGSEKGITGTPMFLINGELVTSYRSVIETIEKKLSE